MVACVYRDTGVPNVPGLISQTKAVAWFFSRPQPLHRSLHRLKVCLYGAVACDQIDCGVLGQTETALESAHRTGPNPRPLVLYVSRGSAHSCHFDYLSNQPVRGRFPPLHRAFGPIEQGRLAIRVIDQLAHVFRGERYRQRLVNSVIHSEAGATPFRVWVPTGAVTVTGWCQLRVASSFLL